MKNKKILIGLLVVLIIAIIVAIVIVFFNNIKSTFSIKNNDDGSSISVTAENASENSGGIGYITIKEGQKLEANTELEEGSIKIEVLDPNTNSVESPIMEEEFKQNDNSTFELPTGNYSINIKVNEKATGNMTIIAK